MNFPIRDAIIKNNYLGISGVFVSRQECIKLEFGA
jgi:hypothetical protein